MKAIAIDSYGAPDNLRDVDLPVPEPGEGDVRIRVLAASFNPVDCKMRQGMRGGALPMVLGLDLCGTVDAVGEGVAEFAPGDAVWAFIGGPRSNGSNAEYVTVPEAFVAAAPKGISPVQAAAMPLAGLTAYRSIRKCGLNKDELVFVAGASGGVGSMLVQLARSFGAGEVVATAGSEASADYISTRLGVPSSHILMYRDLDLDALEREFLEITEDRHAESAYDFVGGVMKRLCCRVAAPGGGVLTTVEEPPGFDLNVWSGSASPLFFRSVSVHLFYLLAEGRFGGRADWLVYRRGLDALSGLIEAGELRPPKVTVIGRLSAETVREAHRLLEEGHVQGKLVMEAG